MPLLSSLHAPWHLSALMSKAPPSPLEARRRKPYRHGAVGPRSPGLDTLTLTSPNTQGPDVLFAQQLLAVNPFGAFYSGDLDGVFGPDTARACRRAKFWLGYAEGQLKPTFGPPVAALLEGRKMLTAAQLGRREERLAAAKKKPLRLKAYEEAVQHLGVKESPPDSNRVLYSDWYGVVGPWCAMFVTYCYVTAGSTVAFSRGSRWAYCPFMLTRARAGEDHLAIAAKPQRGDVVLYGFGDTEAKHVGLLEGFTDGAGSFTAIEGNTSAANDSNGGAVMRRNRSTSQVLAFVRVGA
jgi:CHAP domain